MFRDAKVGDRVWHMSYGWGVIKSLFEEDFIKRMKVHFKNRNTIAFFIIDGRRNLSDIHPTLFWDEIKFEIPEKPFDLEYEYRKLQEREFVPKIINYEIVYNPKSRLWSAQGRRWTKSMLVKYFERGQTMNNFIDLLNERKIQPEELERVIRKVEREEQE